VCGTVLPTHFWPELLALSHQFPDLIFFHEPQHKMPYLRLRFKRRRSIRRSRGLRFRRRYRRRFRRFRRSFRRRRTFTQVRVGYRRTDRVFQKLVFYQTITRGGSALTLDEFRGSDIYQPYPPVSVQNANPYPRFSGHYRRWIVFGSKISVKVVNTQPISPTPDLRAPVTCVIVPTKYLGGVLNSSVDDLAEQQYAVRKDIQANTGGPSVATLRSYMRTAKIWNVPPRKIMDNYDFGGTSDGAGNTSPNNQWLWQVYLDSMDGTTTWAAIYRIRIVYYAMFYDPPFVEL